MIVTLNFKDTSKESWCGIGNIIFNGEDDTVILIPQGISEPVIFNINDISDMVITDRFN